MKHANNEITLEILSISKDADIDISKICSVISSMVRMHTKYYYMRDLKNNLFTNQRTHLRFKYD